MQKSDLALISHLMRRAGFGATREELEVLSTRSYEAVVEDLVHPERFPDIDEDIAQRYFGISFGSKSQWIYRMVNTRRPLEEKIAAFLAPRLRDRKHQDEPGRRPDRHVPGVTASPT